MIHIPIDKLEEDLTRWILIQLRNEQMEEKDIRLLNLLLRISKSQMVQRNRGDEYPFIEDLYLTTEDYSLIQENDWINNDNVEVRAYCLDILSRQVKDKREIKRRASDAYLELYEKRHTPWYIVRSVEVRFFVKGEDGEYLKVITSKCLNIHGTWLKFISNKLRRDCKENLDEYMELLESKISNLEEKRCWYDAVDCLDALNEIGKMANEEYHLRRANLYEAAFDYGVETQTETTYNMKLDLIQNAYKEISKIKKQYPGVHERIRSKMIAEQIVFAEKMRIFGVPVTYTIPNKLVEQINDYLKETPMSSPFRLIEDIARIKFPSPATIKKESKALVKANPIIYTSFGNSEAIGEKGEILGKADGDTTLKIATHKRIRNRIHYLTQRLLIDYLSHTSALNELALEQALIDGGKASYIEESRKILWAKGIVEGCKGEIIVAAHILMPQIERSLVIKAQQLCGDLTNYEREHHDQIGLDRALLTLKPYMKGAYYDELSLFLYNGADVNFRNGIAHGIMEPLIIEKEGLNLWWLAIKLFFRENEIFKKA